MIARLKGIVAELQDSSLVLEINGIGYMVYMNVAEINLDQELSLFIKTIIREDAFDLYGFIDKSSMIFFNSLIQVNGIGPKLAMNILCNASLDSLQYAIDSQDSKNFEKVPGVGKKMAAKILLELKGKKIMTVSMPEVFYEALDALNQLGFEKKNAHEIVSNLIIKTQNLGDIITEALKNKK